MSSRTIFTEAVIADMREHIPHLIAEGRSIREIADTIGCRPGSLKVKCAQLGISLRRRRVLPELKPPRQKVSPLRPMLVELAPRIFALFDSKSRAAGVQPQTLAASLLTIIARDDLFNAVLDNDDALAAPVITKDAA